MIEIGRGIGFRDVLIGAQRGQVEQQEGNGQGREQVGPYPGSAPGVEQGQTYAQQEHELDNGDGADAGAQVQRGIGVLGQQKRDIDQRQANGNGYQQEGAQRPPGAIESGPRVGRPRRQQRL